MKLELDDLKKNELIPQDFCLEEGNHLELILKRLQVQVLNLLQTDPSKLIRILYRLDVNEFKVKKTLKNSNLFDVSFEISQLIIDREMEKSLSRQKYSNESK